MVETKPLLNESGFPGFGEYRQWIESMLLLTRNSSFMTTSLEPNSSAISDHPSQQYRKGKPADYCDRMELWPPTGWHTDSIEYCSYAYHPVKRYSPKPGKPDSLSNGFVSTIVPAAQGKLWLGTMTE